jgi:hypothetical protein
LFLASRRQWWIVIGALRPIKPRFVDVVFAFTVSN